MEISDDFEATPSAEDVFETEVQAVFQETLGLIHIALVSHYQLTEQEATELEKDLFVWFRRFCYRPGHFDSGESSLSSWSLAASSPASTRSTSSEPVSALPTKG